MPYTNTTSRITQNLAHMKSMKSMRAAYALIAALAITLPAGATNVPPPEPPKVVDKWSGEDKGIHLATGAVISAASTIKWESRALGFGIGCGAGVAFELLAPGFKSYKDAVMSCLGAAFGAVIGGWHINGQRNGVIVRKEF